MPEDNATTIENEQMAAELEQKRSVDERASEESAELEGKEKPAGEHFISSGEIPLLLASGGSVEILQWALDLIPYAGWILNGGIAFVVGFTFFIWLSGKIAKGAPKKWYKAVYYGAAGGALPIIPGFLGAIIWLLIQDRKILGKTAGKLMEKI